MVSTSESMSRWKLRNVIALVDHELGDEVQYSVKFKLPYISYLLLNLAHIFSPLLTQNSLRKDAI